MIQQPFVIVVFITGILLLCLVLSFLRAGLNTEGITVRDRKNQCFFQEKVPGAFWLKWLYHTAFGKIPLHLLVKHRALSVWYGKKMDKPSSKKAIQPFISDLDIDMSESERQAEDFTNFNDFFTRKLKPGVRPVAENPSAVVSPGDGRLLSFASLQNLDSFYVKGSRLTLETLLDNAALADEFKNGSAFFLRLAPADYHRFHFPVSGKASKPRVIHGLYYSVSPLAVRKNITVFMENVRHITQITTDKSVTMVMVEVGATLVGSIVQTFRPDTITAKGSEKGYFCFGGSSILLIFPEGAVQIDDDILKNTRDGIETRVLMGEQIGLLNSGK